MDEVLRRFARLAGLTEQQALDWNDICGDAYLLLEAQRKFPCLPNQSGDLVCAAAAALAFYRYVLHRNAAAEPDFSLGDFKMAHNHKGVEFARQFWLQALKDAAPLLKDPEFCFLELKL